MKLNLGAGSRVKDGWVNVDAADVPGVDVVHDLDTLPWPFDDGSADGIEAFDVFEHVDNPVGFMTECWRVLKPGAEVYIHTTYWRSKNCYTDPTHKRFCTKSTFDYWIRGTRFFTRYGAAYGGHSHPFTRTVTRVRGGELIVILRKAAAGGRLRAEDGRVPGTGKASVRLVAALLSYVRLILARQRLPRRAAAARMSPTSS